MDKPVYDPFAAMRIPEYRNLMMGRFLFIMGLRMMGTLVGWWIYELTNDPFAIGLIGLSEVIPAVSLSLYAGHVIDISEKRKLLLRGVTLYFVCALFLLLLSTSYTTAQFSKHWIAFSIYIIIFFTGISFVHLPVLLLERWWHPLYLGSYSKMPLPGIRGSGFLLP